MAKVKIQSVRKKIPASDKPNSYFILFLIIFLLTLLLHTGFLLSGPIIYGPQFIPWSGEFSFWKIFLNTLAFLFPEGILLFIGRIFSIDKEQVENKKGHFIVFLVIFLVFQLIFLGNTFSFVFIHTDLAAFLSFFDLLSKSSGSLTAIIASYVVFLNSSQEKE